MTQEQEAAKQRVADFADSIGQTYSRLMKAARLYLVTGDETQDNSEGYKAAWSGDVWEKFWDNYVIITGQSIEENKRRDCFFFCSC